MLREAEEAVPPARGRRRHDQDAGAAVPLIRRRSTHTLPSPRSAADDALTARPAGRAG
jgi:hypothetical protein